MASNPWEQIENIFLTAADLPREEQAAFLDQACGGDEELRREVQSLINSDRKSGEKITRAVETEAQSLFGLSPIIGSRLGSYRVIREIGRGGMGAVYLATRDDDQFHKNVAIKLVKRGMDTAEVLDRFRHERRILAGLDHAYIARLIDAGTTDDGRPFFVMEYVEGQMIDAYCRDHALDLAARCALFLKVCEAVSHAHRNLVVHRDLKPGNIFVTPDGTPKLLDFGVAKLLAPDADPHLTVTAMQSRLITPQYASPEQVMGRPVNTATDVYSLGAVLYELLTGSCAQQLDSTSPEEIERVICIQEVRPPSAMTRAPGLSRDVLLGDVDNIVMMAMRKDPSRRYQSVDQLADDVRRYLNGRPIFARKDSISYRTGKFVRRHSLIIAAAALVVASLVGGIIIAMSQARRAERRLTQMVELANRSLFDVHTAIERLPGSTEARRAIVKTTLEFLENLSKDAGRDDRVRLPLANAYFRLGDIQGYPFKPNLGDSAGALASYHKASALLDPLRAKHPGDPEILRAFLDISNHTGAVASQIGDVPSSVKAFETALPAAQAIARLNPANKEAVQFEGLFYNDLARALEFSDPKKANEYGRKHLALIPGLLKQFPNDDDILDQAANAYATMGSLLSRSGDLLQGLEQMRACADIREKSAARHPNDAVRQRSLMIAYGHVGDFLGSPFTVNIGDAIGARQYFDKCVIIARGMVAADPQDHTAQFDLANALLRQAVTNVPPSEFPQSLASLREATGIVESLSIADPHAVRFQRTLAMMLEYTGSRLRDMNQPDQALIELRHSAAVTDTIFAGLPGDASTLSQIVKTEELMANIFLARGDSASALAHAQRGLALAQKYSTGPEAGLRQRYVGVASLSLANIDRALGKWQDAHEAAQRAIDSWNSPGVVSVNPKHREQANAILIESAAHFVSK